MKTIHVFYCDFTMRDTNKTYLIAFREIVDFYYWYKEYGYNIWLESLEECFIPEEDAIVIGNPRRYEIDENDDIYFPDENEESD